MVNKLCRKKIRKHKKQQSAIPQFQSIQKMEQCDNAISVLVGRNRFRSFKTHLIAKVIK